MYMQKDIFSSILSKFCEAGTHPSYACLLEVRFRTDDLGPGVWQLKPSCLNVRMRGTSTSGHGKDGRGTAVWHMPGCTTKEEEEQHKGAGGPHRWYWIHGIGSGETPKQRIGYELKLPIPHDLATQAPGQGEAAGSLRLWRRKVHAQRNIEYRI